MQDATPQYIQCMTYLETNNVIFDDENAFSSIKRQAFLHNINYICPTIANLVRNCYNVPARLFALGGKELLSHERTTQGDPTAMEIYGIALTPLLIHLATCYPERDPKMVAFADDLTSAGRYRNCVAGGRSFWMLGRSTVTFQIQARQY